MSLWRRAPEAPATTVTSLLQPERTVFRSPAVAAYDRRTAGYAKPPLKPPGRICLEIQDGTVLVGSDGHWWPNQTTTAERAFIGFAQMLQPALVVMNGDAVDAAGISRFGELTWASRDKVPSVVDQLEATRENLRDIEFAAPNARKIWTLGNHDARFEKFIMDRAPEYAGVTGFSLKDHFAGWEPCWSVEINEDVMVKHRFRGGVYASRNNTVAGGRTIVTGHLHSLQVTPVTDYNGTRWGVDCGTLSDPRLPQYEYTEDNPLNWRSGFVVLTFREGRLLWPEIVWARPDGVVEWRGQEIKW